MADVGSRDTSKSDTPPSGTGEAGDAPRRPSKETQQNAYEGFFSQIGKARNEPFQNSPLTIVLVVLAIVFFLAVVGLIIAMALQANCDDVCKKAETEAKKAAKGGISTDRQHSCSSSDDCNDKLCNGGKKQGCCAVCAAGGVCQQGQLTANGCMIPQ